MFPISPWRALAFVAALTSAIAGIDALVLASGAPQATRDLASTGVLVLLLVSWPWLAPRVLPLLISGAKVSHDQAHLQRLRSLMDSLPHGDFAKARFVVHTGKGLSAVTSGHRGASVIAVSTGLLDELDDDQLRAALAHERGHIEGGHLILSSGFLATLFLAKSLFGALGLPMTLALLLVYLALLRRNELDADRRAAALAGPGDLVRLLLNLKSKLKEPACLDWPGMSVLSTHPGFRVRAARVLGTSARSLS